MKELKEDVEQLGGIVQKQQKVVAQYQASTEKARSTMNNRTDSYSNYQEKKEAEI